jgi:heterodisulfide reductase subunit A
VALEDGRPQVTARDPVIGRKVTIDADVLVLSSGMVPSDNIDLAQLLDLQLDIDGFFQEMDPKWRPVDTSLRGVFICGVAHSPRSITESIAMAEGAAQRAVRFLSKAQMSVGSTVASVDERLCTGCRTCEGLCPYDAVDFSDDSKTAHVNAVLCQGCGACAAACPTSAIGVSRYTADEIYAHIEGKLT